MPPLPTTDRIGANEVSSLDLNDHEAAGSYALWSDNPSSLDLLAFSAVAETVASALLDDHLDPVVLGVSGRWGSGKICRPRLVQTGLDLIDFPTLIWYETDYSVYTMRQASRRSWRIGQTRPVRVVFMAYRGKLQSDALQLVAKKLQSSLAVEGELPEEGLAAFGDDGDDLMLALARKIVNEEEEEQESVEEVFAQAREAEALSEELLVDEGWHAVEVDAESAMVEAHRNGTGATVEVEAANGHHHDEAPETQQSLFSWAEFMAETPVKPSRRNGKPQLEALSMFEWALSLEKGREEELVDAGR